MKNIETVGVLGCGLMGGGITQVTAAAGYKTIVREVDDAALQRGLDRISKSLETSVKKGKLSASARDVTLSNMSGVTELERLADCDLVIEAIVENLDEKGQTYRALDQVLKEHGGIL